MPYTFYKILHLFGVITLLTALGGAVFYALQGITQDDDRTRKLRIIFHGVAMGLILVAGFGMLAKLQIPAPGDWPLWVWLKLMVWLALGAMPTLIKRMPAQATIWVYTTIALATLSGMFAVLKVGT